MEGIIFLSVKYVLPFNPMNTLQYVCLGSIPAVNNVLFLNMEIGLG